MQHLDTSLINATLRTPQKVLGAATPIPAAASRLCWQQCDHPSPFTFAVAKTVQRTPLCRTCNSAGPSSPPWPPTPPRTSGRKTSIRTKPRPYHHGSMSTRAKKSRIHSYLPQVLARDQTRDTIDLHPLNIIAPVENGTVLEVLNRRC